MEFLNKAYKNFKNPFKNPFKIPFSHPHPPRESQGPLRDRSVTEGDFCLGYVAMPWSIDSFIASTSYSEY